MCVLHYARATAFLSADSIPMPLLSFEFFLPPAILIVFADLFCLANDAFIALDFSYALSVQLCV